MRPDQVCYGVAHTENLYVWIGCGSTPTVFPLQHLTNGKFEIRHFSNWPNYVFVSISGGNGMDRAPVNATEASGFISWDVLEEELEVSIAIAVS